MRSRAGAVALLLSAALVLTGCGGSALHGSPTATASTGSTPVRTDVPQALQAVAMPRPGAFKPPLASADILVTAQDPLSKRFIGKVKSFKTVVASEQFSLATFYRDEDPITYAAVDPETFRRFTPGPTATLDEVWDRVADGEIAIRPDLRQALVSADDYITMGNDTDAQRAHVGAFAPLVDRSKIGAIVNDRWARRLHMPAGNALLVSTGKSSPAKILKKLRSLVGDRASVALLAPHVDPNASQTAVLTGGSVSQAVGSFTYTANTDGTVNPDPRWVSAYIRTEQVPIIGSVTCNKGMIGQLRMALNEVVRNHLSSAIHPSEYGGCYVPRYIAKDPAKGLSFHTFGTAIDLNVPGNQRGTVGTIDRRVVDIFKRCGFNWGGDWNYTDPMHFELARLVSSC